MELGNRANNLAVHRTWKTLRFSFPLLIKKSNVVIKKKSFRKRTVLCGEPLFGILTV